MKNVGDKDDPENRQNWRAGMNLVWNPVASTPKFIKGDFCRLLCILSAEKIDRLKRSFWHSESKASGTVYWRKGISGWRSYKVCVTIDVLSPFISRRPHVRCIHVVVAYSICLQLRPGQCYIPSTGFEIVIALTWICLILEIDSFQGNKLRSSLFWRTASCRYARCAATGHLSFDITVPVSNDVWDTPIHLVDNYNTLSVIVSLSLLLNNADLAFVEYSRTRPWHHKASSTQLEPGLSHLSLRPWDPSTLTPTILLSPPTRSLTAKKLQSRPLQDFSIDLLVIPCIQLGKEVTSRSRPPSKT